MRILLPLSVLALAACSSTPPSAPPGAQVGHREPTVRPGVSAEQATAHYNAAIDAVRDREGERQTVQTADGLVVLYRWEEPRLIVSEACAPQGRIGGCDALTALREIASKDVEVGAGTPASYYCKPAGGESLPARSERGESELCKFADGSMLDSWSLVYVPQFGKEQIAKGK